MKKNIVALMVSSVAAAAVLAGCGTTGNVMGTERGLSSKLGAKGAVTGTKRALLVGINKYECGSNLNGCVNDINDVKAKLMAPEGFTDVTTVLDGQATRDGILNGLNKLVASAKPGDFLYFHYSGHGAQVPDVNGDEKDGQDEIICPTDLAFAGNSFKNVILDDEINTILGKLPAGVGFTMISDSCHSATQTQGMTRFRGINMPKGGKNLDRSLINPALQQKFESRLAADKYTLISGCQDNQTSADAYINGRYNGALTYNLLEAYKAGGRTMTNAQWHKLTLDLVKKGRYSQTPNILGAVNDVIFTISN